MAEARTLCARQGDKLDLMLWRDMGLGPDHVARVFAANKGLADLGPILPMGTAVIVPPLANNASPSAPPLRPLIQLWD